MFGAVACNTETFGSDPYPGVNKKCAVGKQAAPSTGWAGQGGGITGGSGAPASAIYLVSSGSQLVAALKTQGDNPKIIKLQGMIDMAAADNGGAFKDPNDGSSGNWNSEYDGITVANSRNVRIDHNVFTDGLITDDKLPVENGKIRQCHDGALDVKNGSDYVTISNNRFELHQKNNLIGSSDSRTTDDGHLTVTFHGNHFLNVAERSARASATRSAGQRRTR